MVEESTRAALPLFRLKAWEARYGVRAGVTGRGDPDLPFDLGLGQDGPTAETEGRWRRLLEELEGFRGVALGRQVHGGRVAWHGQVDGMLVLPGIDGHATATPGTLLAVTLADCIPVYLFDPGRRAVGLVHAGWRGTSAGIVAEAVALLQRAVGSRPSEIVMHCGVGICGDCYEVGPEVLAACTGGVAHGKGHLDLRRVLAEQGHDLGLGEVSVSERCSAHDPGAFFSHRASRGAQGRMAAYLGLIS